MLFATKLHEALPNFVSITNNKSNNKLWRNIHTTIITITTTQRH